MDVTLTLAVGAVTTVSAVLLWHLWSRRSRHPRPSAPLQLPAELSFRREALLSKDEAALFNVLSLAVREHYLVLAKVPVGRLLHVEGKWPGEEPLAARFLRSLARPCADFVLLHPGTLTAAAAITLEGATQEGGRRSVREQLAELALTAAGVRLIRLDPREAYTVPVLAECLGLEPRD